jgi:hypothetical protein
MVFGWAIRLSKGLTIGNRGKSKDPETSMPNNPRGDKDPFLESRVVGLGMGGKRAGELSPL